MSVTALWNWHIKQRVLQPYETAWHIKQSVLQPYKTAWHIKQLVLQPYETDTLNNECYSLMKLHDTLNN